MISPEVLEKIKPGAMVRVWEKIPAGSATAAGEKKGEKERLSKFEGLVLARKHGKESGASFTVRATVAGVGMEKVYPIYSPMIDKVDVLSSPRKVHRAKLYYIRGLSKKEIRQKISSEKSSV